MELWRFLNYTSPQIDLVARRTAVAINNHIATVMRNAVPPDVWLGGNATSWVDTMEFWRWSWTRSEVRSLLSPTLATALIQSNLVLAAVGAAIMTGLLLLLTVVQLSVTKPWRCLTITSMSDEEDADDREYQRTEFAIVWFRTVP